MAEVTCGSCRHWHQVPIDVNNLSAPRPGECRGAPPATGLVPGPQGPMRYTLYPLLPAEFPACGRHEPAVTIPGG